MCSHAPPPPPFLPQTPADSQATEEVHLHVCVTVEKGRQGGKFLGYPAIRAH